jgi:hypothetical protein
MASRPNLTHNVPLWRLDLYNVCTHVTERLRGERTHEDRRHVDDANAVQGSHGVVLVVKVKFSVMSLLFSLVNKLFIGLLPIIGKLLIYKPDIFRLIRYY